MTSAPRSTIRCSVCRVQIPTAALAIPDRCISRQCPFPNPAVAGVTRDTQEKAA